MAQRNSKQSALERWARFSHRRRGRVIFAWVIGLVAVLATGIMFSGEFDSGFDIPGTESQKALDLLEVRTPERAGSDGELVFQHAAGVESAEAKPRIEAVLAEV